MPIDPGAETQVIPGFKGRNIYDASAKEIAWKSFLAGLFLGLGKTVASIILWGAVLLLSVQLIEPLLAPIMNQLQQLTNTLSPASSFLRQDNSTDINQIFEQFNNRGL